MSTKTGFFDSVITGTDEDGLPIYDRAQSAEFFAGYFSAFIQNGVTADSYTVTADGTLNLILSAGKAVINGYFRWDDDITVIPITPTSAQQKLRIILRLSLADRDISLITRSSSEALVRTNDVYELAIADVTVVANAVGMAQADVTDLRSNSELCGLCGTVVAGHKHSATDITSGTLPVSRGGTGATNNAGLWSAAASGGIIYSSSTPTVVNGKIWLKPI